MQSCVFVISINGERLMPTKRFGKVRRLLRDGKAVIAKHRPFTIQLTYKTGNHTQPLEFCQDTGYQHIGNSLKSKAHEYVSEELILLKDEKQRHDDARRYRRARRNSLRYRKPRFNNRRKDKKWLAPSLKHKEDIHLREIAKYAAVVPITDIYIEVGVFDPALLKAIANGESIPQGIEYQHGDLYAQESLRKAIFQRDGYKCCFCGRSIDDGAILHVHHALFWMNHHGDQLNELTTVCEKCHTSANHKEGGLLWGYKPKKFENFESATFMNAVRWDICNKLKEMYPDINIHRTYGAKTSLERKLAGIDKSHCNDAYVMGELRPNDRCIQNTYQKVRRNNRILSKFYDAKIIDTRDGKPKKGAELGSERTNRREQRNSDKSLRKYRGTKTSKGRVSIRKRHYSIRPGDTVLWKNNPYIAKGVQNNGAMVKLSNSKVVNLTKTQLLKHTGGWQFLYA